MRVILGGIAIAMLCSVGIVGAAHAQTAQTEWYTYRHDRMRTGSQPYASDLSDPAKAAHLSVQWSFPKDGEADHKERAFKASPIVINDTVFIGSINGYFYALDAQTGTLKWQYPKAGDADAALLGSCVSDNSNLPPRAQNFGRYGIQSSATYATIGGQDAIIFGAPDPTAEGGHGSARLFALDFSSGNPIWKNDGVDGSEIVAHIIACDPGSTQHRHERIAFSSPLVLGDKVYVGIHDTGDNPIEQGTIRVVDLSSGKLVSTPDGPGPFSYVSTGTPGDSTRGGGVWNSLATDGMGVYFTTGNTQPKPYCHPPGGPNNCPLKTEPPHNHGLSMIRVDKDTGNLLPPGGWVFQPVDFFHDGDPDWAAGAAVMSTSCGELIASVQKDGWSYAVNASDGSMRWQFPPTIQTHGRDSFLNKYKHGDDGYRQPGAVWNDVLIIKSGGYALDDKPTDNVAKGYRQLHALNACAADQDRVRWIADLASYTLQSGEPGYSISAPTVTGGIVFVGTDKGHLVVLGDPSVVPAAGSTCSDVEYKDSPSTCTAAGHALVPIPSVLKDIPMPDGGNIAGLRNEPALANGRVYVGTLSGHVYMLDGFAPPVIADLQPQYRRCGDATPVTIIGTNFNDIRDVSMRDTTGVTTQVGFDRDSSAQLTAHIPNTISAGRYDLIVHTAHGSSNLSQFFVTPTVDSINPMSGPATGGDEITINGTCFHSGTSVYFGSIQANTFAGEGCASNSQCKVFSPATATAGPVDVVASDGANSANTPPNPQFTYNGPNITGFSPKSGPISGGTLVEITGSGFPAYDGKNPLNMQVSFGDVQTMAECFFTDCEVVTPKAMHPGPVHITATAFGISSISADLFTYNQYPALTKFLVPGPPHSEDGAIFLDGNAPAEGAPIQLTSSDPSAVSAQPVTIPPGSQETSVPVTFLPTSKTETVTLTAAYQGSSLRAIVNVIAWPPLSIELGADHLGIDESTTATVRLNPIPAADAVVDLKSSEPSLVQVPMNVKVPGGSYIGTFAVDRRAPRRRRPITVTITAAYGGASASADVVLRDNDDCTDCGTPERCCVCNGGTWVGGKCKSPN